MIKCNICNTEFKNNLGGQLTNHLKENHDMSVEDYYVKFILNGVEPKCKCGYCNERPNFYRGKFRSYAINHNKFQWIEKKYIEKYGHPKCHNKDCDNFVKFHRGKPNKFCSFKCHESKWNQEKVGETVKIKYGVDHNSKTEKNREISSKNMCKYNANLNTNHKIRYYKETKLYYQSQYEYRFLELSEKLGLLDMLDNSHTFKYEDKSLGKWHLPDFIFDKKYVIEIKSTYWMNRQGGIDRIKYKKESVEILGYKYIFILDENYDEFYNVLQNGAIDIHK